MKTGMIELTQGAKKTALYLRGAQIESVALDPVLIDDRNDNTRITMANCHVHYCHESPEQVLKMMAAAD